MRKFYILGIAALTAGSVMATPSAPSIVSKSKKAHRTELGKTLKKKSGWRAEAKGALWRPGTQVISEWNPDKEAWEESSKMLSTYDGEGHVLTDETISLVEGDGSQRTTYEYDEFGMPVSRLVEVSEDGNGYVNYSRTVRVYDPVVHTCIISNTEYLWIDGEWVEMGNCYRREITRNEDGSVTQVVIKTLYDGNYEASQKLDVEYGTDGKASRIVTSVLTYGENDDFVWETEMEYKNIVWDHTDGQIISADDITSAENGISSCVVLDADGENDVTVEYPDSNGSFKSKLVYANGTLDVSMLYLDSYGSYDYSQTETYKEEDEEDEYSYTSVERYRVNEYGLDLENFAGEAEGDSEIMPVEWMKGEVISNPEHGYPDLYTVTAYDYETDAFVNMMQVKMEDYSDVAGVGAVDVDNQASPVEYFNMQGMRVNGDFAPGIYIRKQGTDVKKIMK